MLRISLPKISLHDIWSIHVNMLRSSYVVKARNAGEAMSDFEWQGSNDGETWTTIETRHVTTWQAHQPQVFVVGSPRCFLLPI